VEAPTGLFDAICIVGVSLFRGTARGEQSDTLCAMRTQELSGACSYLHAEGSSRASRPFPRFPRGLLGPTARAKLAAGAVRVRGQPQRSPDLSRTIRPASSDYVLEQPSRVAVETYAMRAP
jgi:hypothetical protein